MAAINPFESHTFDDQPCRRCGRVHGKPISTPEDYDEMFDRLDRLNADTGFATPNARRLTALEIARRAFPRETWVGAEFNDGNEAFLVRYDGKVYRFTVEEV